MAKVVKLDRKALEPMMVRIGWKLAPGWANEEFCRKLQQVKDVAPSAADLKSWPEGEAALLTTVLAAIEDGSTFDVEGAEPEKAAGKGKASAKPDETPEEKAAREAKAAAEKAAKKAEKEKGREAKKAERTAAREAKKAERLAAREAKKAEREAKRAERKGRVGKHKMYFAGKVVKEFGVPESVSPEMIARLVEISGVPSSDATCESQLKAAIAVVKGFQE